MKKKTRKSRAVELMDFAAPPSLGAAMRSPPLLGSSQPSPPTVDYLSHHLCGEGGVEMPESAVAASTDAELEFKWVRVQTHAGLTQIVCMA